MTTPEEQSALNQFATREEMAAEIVRLKGKLGTIASEAAVGFQEERSKLLKRINDAEIERDDAIKRNGVLQRKIDGIASETTEEETQADGNTNV